MPCSTLPLSGVNNACGTLLLKRKRRLVINSHPAGSQRRLLELFASLWIAGLHQDWHERIIVMMAGSDNCSIGKQLVSEVLHSVLPRLPFSNQSVVVAHTTVNLWDFQACMHCGSDNGIPSQPPTAIFIHSTQLPSNRSKASCRIRIHNPTKLRTQPQHCYTASLSRTPTRASSLAPG